MVVGIVLATRTPQEATAVASPLLGHPAPQLSGTDLSTGAPVSLASLRGHYVVVNFFASWCIPCQQEAPDLSRFYYQQTPLRRRGRHGERGLPRHDVDGQAFLEKNGDLWPAVTDPGGTIAQRYGVTAPPTTFVIDPAGHGHAPCSRVRPTEKNLDTFLRRPAPAGAGLAPMAERPAGLPLWARVALPLVVLGVALLIGSGAFDAVAPDGGPARHRDRGGRAVSLVHRRVGGPVERHDRHRGAPPDREHGGGGQLHGRHRPDARVRVRTDHPVGATRRRRGARDLDHPLVLGRWDTGRGRDLFWRRSRAFDALARKGGRCRDGRPTMSVQRATDASSRDERWYLADEEDFLRRSLEDAGREHEAGDLSDEDYARLGRPGLGAAGRGGGRARRPRARAGRGRDARPRRTASDDARRGARPDGRCGAGSASSVCLPLIVVGAVILVAHFVQARQPGQASSGSVSRVAGPADRAAAAAGPHLNDAAANTRGALELYDKVLAEDPSNPAALAYAG